MHVHYFSDTCTLRGYFGAFSVIFGQKVHENDVFVVSQECID